MFDILPAGGGFDGESFHKHPRKDKREFFDSSVERHIPQPTGPKVVKLQWKLPSRLRRPIREELDRQRDRRRRREQIVQFVRRPIFTRHVLKSEAQKQKGVSNIGVEHHTGDVYKEERPNLRVAPPPYVGRYAPYALTEQTAALRKQRSATSAQQRTPQRVKATQPTLRRRVVQRKTIPIQGERDIPFRWEDYSSTEQPQEQLHEDVYGVSNAADVELVEVRQPKRKLRFPFRISLWPFSTRDIHSRGNAVLGPLREARRAEWVKKNR